MEFEESISPHERVEQTGRNAGNPSFSVQVCRRLQDMVKAVSLGYVVVGYKYMVNNGYYIAMLPVFVMIFVAEMGNLTKEGLRVGIMGKRINDLATLIVSLGVLILTVAIFFISRPRTIYLLDFACYRPSDELKVSKEEFMEKVRKSGKFDEKTLKFQNQVLESSGIGDETYLPKAVLNMENPATMKEGRDETAAVLFGALDELFEKTGVKPRDVGILVVNCSIFNPTPSISAMIVNRYKMRTNTLTYNLGGMGCSASIIAVDLAKEILQANSNSLALVVSTEIITFSWYRGTERSMLIPNCFFRMGGSAVLLSNRWKDYRKSKYELEHIVRVHKGSDERSFRCIYQDEDKEGFKGLGIKRDIIEVGVQALKANIATLAPLVLPFSEQIKFFNFLIRKHLFGSDENTKPYIPNYKLAFNHFCIQGTSKPVLEELQKHLELSGSSMEASKMSLHRFGHTSSSSIWYILAYLEAKEKVDGGDRIWQLAFGSGFKCNSAVWRALHRVKKPSRNPWLDCIDQYPLNI